MSELDLDALEREHEDASFQTDRDILALVVELRACRAERDAALGTNGAWSRKAREYKADAAEVDLLYRRAIERTLDLAARIAVAMAHVNTWRHNWKCESGPICDCGIAQMTAALTGGDNDGT